jgi:hypothetical protein
MENNKAKINCRFYNWGKGYPKIYGARCDKFNKFFSKDKRGKLNPQCSTCPDYEEKP